jgi:hypothetical protein
LEPAGRQKYLLLCLDDRVYCFATCTKYH